MVTVTVRFDPVDADCEIVIVAVMVVGLTTVRLVKVTPAGPVPFAPMTNPDPVRVTGVVDP